MENKLYNCHMLTSWFMVAGWIIFVVLWKYAADKGLITFKGLIFGKKELPFSPTWGLCIASYSIRTQIQHLLQSQISFWPSSAEGRPSSASAHHCKYKLTQPNGNVKIQKGETPVAKYYQDLRVFALLTENFDEGINTSYTQEICE